MSRNEVDIWSHINPNGKSVKGLILTSVLEEVIQSKKMSDLKQALAYNEEISWEMLEKVFRMRVMQVSIESDLKQMKQMICSLQSDEEEDIVHILKKSCWLSPVNTVKAQNRIFERDSDSQLCELKKLIEEKSKILKMMQSAESTFKRLQDELQVMSTLVNNLSDVKEAMVHSDAEKSDQAEELHLKVISNTEQQHESIKPQQVVRNKKTTFSLESEELKNLNKQSVDEQNKVPEKQYLRRQFELTKPQQKLKNEKTLLKEEPKESEDMYETACDTLYEQSKIPAKQHEEKHCVSRVTFRMEPRKKYFAPIQPELREHQLEPDKVIEAVFDSNSSSSNNVAVTVKGSFLEKNNNDFVCCITNSKNRSSHLEENVISVQNKNGCKNITCHEKSRYFPPV